ncbi:MAG: hypothetical protein EA388_06405 [Nitriliruptor sp.]|nr:MAG: hypothetical protein EA388_06405 [Nitriliruptor sp.]
MLPPIWFRRLVLAPAVPVATVLLLISLPVALLVAAVASTRLPGRWRALRVVYFILIYLIVDSIALVWLFVLWVAAGFGRHLGREPWQARHYDLMRSYLATIVRAGRRTFLVDFDTEMDERPGDRGSAPLLVFSRHAGPGDSFLLVHALLQRGFRPRVVLKSTLQWAPVIDIALNRLPAYFVEPGAPPGTGRTAVGELAAGLGSDGALVIFPEGANYTPKRRLHSIAKLEEQGRHAEAEQAREMRHVLRPRSGGALSALEGAPDADVVFVVHTGLEDFSSVADIWRGIPMDAKVRVRGWHVPRTDVPHSPEAAETWLLRWWRQLDAWIIEHHGAAAVPESIVAAVEHTQPGGPAIETP